MLTTDSSHIKKLMDRQTNKRPDTTYKLRHLPKSVKKDAFILSVRLEPKYVNEFLLCSVR